MSDVPQRDLLGATGTLFFAATREDAAHANFDDAFIYEQLMLGPEQSAIRGLHVALPEQMRPFEAWVSRLGKIQY